MAYGGNFSKSIEDGSDDLNECQCTPCAADGYTLEAVDFCQTCDQFLCRICTKHHQRLSKDHKYIPVGYQNTQTLSKSKPDVAKCLSHPDRDIEMYCGTHNMVYCCLCIAKDHRTCKNVEEIGNEVKETDANKVQRIAADFESVNKRLRDMKQNKSTDIIMLKTKKDVLLKEVDLLRKEMNNYLDELERKVKSELDKVLTKIEEELRDDIAAVDNLLATCSKTMPERCFDDTQTFIVEKLGTKVIADANSFLARTKSSKHVDISFNHNTSLYNGIKMADNIGKIIKTERQKARCRKHEVKSNDQLNVKVGSDSRPCVVNGICQLKNGHILIVDQNNHKLKRLDDELKVKDFCDLESEPFGLCPISPNKVAVRFKESVQIILTGQTLSHEKTIKINEFELCYGNSIAVCSGNMWTFDEKSILIFTLSGAMVKMIEEDSKGQKIFPNSNPASIVVNYDKSKMYVADGIDKVVVFDNKGMLINELRDRRLIGTQCVCVTEEECVFVAGYISMNVVMFDNEGNSLGELVTGKDMLSFPRSLCYDRKTHCLLIGYFQTDVLQQFKLLDK